MTVTQPSTEDEETVPSAGKERSGRGWRGGRVAAVVVVLVAAGVGVAVTDPFTGQAKETRVQSSASTGVGHVTKGTLSARTQENGTLGYAGDYQVIGKGSGTVTKLPGVGKVVTQGKPLYWVDGKPVILLYGAYVPVYRALSHGMEGADVRQLNTALVTLGYATKDQIDPDSDYFSWQTYYALRRLQHAVGLERTGSLPLGQAVFVPAKKIRVTKVSAVTGGSLMPGGMVLRGSSMEREVTVALGASQQSDVKTGDKVTLTLPNGQTTPGVVSAVGKVATKGASETTVDVRITPSDPKATGQLDQAPVQVSIATDSVKDVLSVPVNALLALSGGGYAVEVIGSGGTHRLIPVTTGLFDDSAGTVQVSGDGLAVDQKIVVPSS